MNPFSKTGDFCSKCCTIGLVAWVAWLIVAYWKALSGAAELVR